MKDDRRPLWTPEKQALDEVVREAKEDLVPREPDWGAMEARLMDRLAKEPEPLVEDVRAPALRGRIVRFGAVALAAAASFALVVRRDPGTANLDPSTASSADPVAGSLKWTEGSGEVRVAGLTASAGQVLRAGEVLEADGARAVLERPRKVTWLLEKDDNAGVARVRVKSAGESLVLGLDEGSVEAQVVPVPSGEAFAVDVAADGKLVRVAVHGTHLRVSRVGTRMIVDLTEGVVSIGAPPRTGSTIGTLVTAPAHVELDVRDLEHTLEIDHAASAVRAAIPLASAQHEPVAALPKDPASPGAPRPQAAPASQPLAHAAATAAEPAAPAPPTPPKPEAAKPSPPREAIIEAVRSCALLKSSPGSVRVTLTTNLKLRVSPSGDVTQAVFDPPLQGDIQFCAAETIYKTKLDETGAVTIPIEFSY